MLRAVLIVFFLLWFRCDLTICASNHAFSTDSSAPLKIAEIEKDTSLKPLDRKSTNEQLKPTNSPSKMILQKPKGLTMLDDDLQLSEKFSEPSAEWISPIIESENDDNGLQNQTRHTTPDNEETIYTGIYEYVTTEVEGSADGDEISRTKGKFTETVSMTTVNVTSTAESTKDEIFPTNCFQFACNTSEMHVGYTTKFLVPESSNFTVPCTSMLNHTDTDSLNWYYMNGTDKIWKAGTEKENLDLVLNGVVKTDSGAYKCVKKSQELCCHREIVLVVFEMPNYKFHLMILGCVLAVSAIFCLFITTLRKRRTKNYAQFEHIQMKNQQLLS